MPALSAWLPPLAVKDRLVYYPSLHRSALSRENAPNGDAFVSDGSWDVT